MPKPRRVHLYQDKGHGWRWRLVATNGKTVAESGESYGNYLDCLGMVWALHGEKVEYETEDGELINPRLVLDEHET
jgi:hypothetical protein